MGTCLFILALLSFYALVLYGTKQSDWPEHQRISQKNSVYVHEIYKNDQNFAPTPYLITSGQRKSGEVVTDAVLDDSAFSAIAILKGS